MKLKRKKNRNRKNNVIQFKPQFKEGYSVVVKKGTSDSAANPSEKLRIALSHSENCAKKTLPDVERFPTHFYEDGITGVEGSLKCRAIIAHRHFIGDTDYSFYDLMQEIVPKVRNSCDFSPLHQDLID